MHPTMVQIRPLWRLLFPVLCGVLLVLSPCTAEAKGRYDRPLNAVATKVAKLGDDVSAISASVASDRGFITTEVALLKFEDYLYRYMVGDYQTAAEGFFGLVNTGAITDPELAANAHWYLAESLYYKDNLLAAEIEYRAMANVDAHPFRVESVRRLLDILSVAGAPGAFYDYYEAQVLNGRVAVTPRITYQVGKAFFLQGDIVRAKANFSSVTPEAAEYHKARYYLGAIMVQEQNLSAALDYFSDNLNMGVDTDASRKILDLSFLAIARIHYERGEFRKATQAYSGISGDSEYLADKLYELVWCFVKQDEVRQALRAVDFFILAYPEHEYSSSLTLLRGHLYMRLSELQSAEVAYEDVLSEATPIRDALGLLLESSKVPEVLYAALGPAEEAVELGGSTVPVVVLQTLQSDAAIAAAVDVGADLKEQVSIVAESDALIDELKVAVSQTSAVGGFAIARHRGLLTYGLAVRQQLALLDVEKTWLTANTKAGVSADFQQLDTRRLELLEAVVNASNTEQTLLEKYSARLVSLKQERLSLVGDVRELRGEVADTSSILSAGGVDASNRLALQSNLTQLASDLAAVEERLVAMDKETQGLGVTVDKGLTQMIAYATSADALRAGYGAYRQQVQGDLAVGQRIDGLYDDLLGLRTGLSEVLVDIKPREAEEMDRIRGRLAYEAAAVLKQREKAVRLRIDADIVLQQSGEAGLRDLYAVYEETVLRSDLGVMDIYWERTTAVKEEKRILIEKKNGILSDLDQRFQLIRKKVNQ
jgi:tetratricopeptide (TPR) repeat protein